MAQSELVGVNCDMLDHICFTWGKQKANFTDEIDRFYVHMFETSSHTGELRIFH